VIVLPLVSFGHTMLLTVCIHFGRHSKCYSETCKYLKIMPATNAACCTAPLLLTANATSCSPHAPNHFLKKPPKLLQVYCTSRVLKISIDPTVFIKSTTKLVTLLDLPQKAEDAADQLIFEKMIIIVMTVIFSLVFASKNIQDNSLLPQCVTPSL
jgi:hypothetical protein